MRPQATALSFILHVSFDIMRVSDYIDSNLLVDINFSLNFSYESVQLVERIDSEQTKDQITACAWAPDKK